jgi:hypothetical protein
MVSIAQKQLKDTAIHQRPRSSVLGSSLPASNTQATAKIGHLGDVLRLSLLLRYFRSYSEKEVKKWISRP